MLRPTGKETAARTDDRGGAKVGGADQYVQQVFMNYKTNQEHQIQMN